MGMHYHIYVEVFHNNKWNCIMPKVFRGRYGGFEGCLYTEDAELRSINENYCYKIIESQGCDFMYDMDECQVYQPEDRLGVETLLLSPEILETITPSILEDGVAYVEKFNAGGEFYLLNLSVATLQNWRDCIAANPLPDKEVSQTIYNEILRRIEWFKIESNVSVLLENDIRTIIVLS